MTTELTPEEVKAAVLAEYDRLIGCNKSEWTYRGGSERASEISTRMKQLCKEHEVSVDEFGGARLGLTKYDAADLRAFLGWALHH